jgi:hypothetical protein
MAGHRATGLLLALAAAGVLLSACATPDPGAPPVEAAPAESQPPAAAASISVESGGAAATPPATVFPEVAGPQPLAIEPLSELVPGATEFLESRERQWAFAVYLPERNAIYHANGDQPFPMASVVKVVIMLAFLDQRLAGGTPLAEADLDLLQWMVTESDNWAAERLWYEIGGDSAIAAFTEKHSLTGIDVEGAPGWGDVTATAIGLTRLFALLYEESFLDEPSRSLAADLLAAVIEEQQWGASAAFPPWAPAGTFGTKNGWYPALTGWRVNSVAMQLGGSSEPMVLAGLTRNQESFEYAVETIERVAQRIGSAVYGIPIEPLPPGEPDGFVTVSEVYSAPGAGLLTSQGECTQSRVAPREGAYACQVAGQTFDPCVDASEGLGIVCGARPGNLSGAFVVRALAATGDPLPANAAGPWLIQLEGGAYCQPPAVAPPFNVDGDRVTYECADGRLILGPLQMSRVWWGYAIDAVTGEGTQTRVAKAWY